VSELDQLLAGAVAREDLPFVVAMVGDRDGVRWQGGFGNANAVLAAGPQTLFRMFSMTKAVGALAVLIMVDRGQLSLDTPVTAILPEFDGIQVLETMGMNGPVLRRPRTPVTLLHLLTHTSGLAYETWDMKQAIWQLVTGSPHSVNGTIASLHTPLMFDPGEGVTYGIGFDWAGRMVQEVDGRAADVFCSQEIFEPLGLTGCAFEPDVAREQLADVRLRGADGHFGAFELAPAPHPEVYGLGQAMYGTAPDYLRILRLVLNGGELDGVRLISPESVRVMTENQIGKLSVPVMRTYLPLLSADVDFFPHTRKTWTAAFMRNEEDIPGMRAAGSLTWAGFLNTHYWIDPVNDVAAVLMSQSLPFCDPRFMDTYHGFEQAVYRAMPELRRQPAIVSVEA
jgi:CubicO group peptidase (beta-lactamase class C family)